MSNKDYLYARSSSYKQNIETQVKTLDYLHIPEENIIKDKGITGKKLGSNRKGFKNLIAKLTPDDNVHVTSIDRLGRLPNVLENAIQIIQNTGANIITHSETDINILETNTITLKRI